MITSDERHAREERKELRAKLQPIQDKLGRGNRLSAAEQRDALGMVEALDELNERIGHYELNRSAAVASAASMGGAPVFGDESKSAEERAFARYVNTGQVTGELRAAGEGTGSGGGYLVPPGWWQRLQIAMKAYGGTQADFQLLETDTGQPMNWATVDPTTTVGTLIAENNQISDVDYTFGQGILGAYAITGGVQKTSRQLAQDSAFNMQDFVTARVAESLGRAEAAYAISGTGSNQPLGINTALAAKSSAGTVGGAITPTGGFITLQAAQQVRTLSVSPTAAGEETALTELTGNLLSPGTVLAMIRAVDPAYRALGAKFYMNDTQLQQMRSLVDVYGRPFYDSLQGIDPDLHGYKVQVDNNIGNLAASTTQGPIFGHLQSAMVLRRVRGGEVMRLEERYADFLQIGFIGWERIDMRSNDLRAAVTVRGGAS